MAFIPPNAKWYVADLVEEIRVPGRRRNHVWINTVLIRADSPEEAYRKSLQLGRDGNTSYKNISGQKVVCKFRGIKQLNVIHDSLEHGCELFFRSKLLAEDGIKRQVSKKQSLAVFQTLRRMRAWKTFFPKKIADKLTKRGCVLEDNPGPSAAQLAELNRRATAALRNPEKLGSPRSIVRRLKR